MSYLPAPYESAQQDDLPAALGAGLTATLAGITSWILGHRAASGVRTLVDLGKADRTATLPKALLVPTAGWAIATVLLVLGALLLVFRRGRGLVIFGALVCIATTAVARYTYQYGTGSHPISQWALYWGGVVVLVVAVLPATGRWVSRRAQPAPPFPASATYLAP